MTELTATTPQPLDRLCPAARLVGLVCLSVPAALAVSLPGAAVSLVFGAALVPAAGLRAGPLLRRLAVVNGFIVFLWALLPLTYPGDPLFSLGPIPFSREGALMAARITLKSNGLVLVFLSLAGALDMGSLGRGLTALRAPSSLVQVLLFTARYVHVLRAEYRRLRQAARARAFTPSTSVHTYRTYAYMVGMLLVRSHERARRVYWAMLCRGFTGVFPAPCRNTWAGGDILFAAFAFAAGLGLAVWDRLLLSPTP